MTREQFQKHFYKAHGYATEKVGTGTLCWGDLLADKFCELLAKDERKPSENACHPECKEKEEACNACPDYPLLNGRGEPCRLGKKCFQLVPGADTCSCGWSGKEKS